MLFLNKSMKIMKYLMSIPKKLYYKRILKKYSFNAAIISPLGIDGSKNISIGKGVTIAYKTWLAALPLTGEKKCELIIKDGAVIGHFNHIYATKSIIIEENALTADRVYISDNLHDYTDPKVPIRKQKIIQKNPVVIGAGSWLGEHVCVIGASVGRNSVVGANSVVTKSIPDYCVAVGIPARIIKRYNFETNKWEKTNSDGTFLI
jgi:acetyltransferase-like isoleucine patch superfamily enzyme